MITGNKRSRSESKESSNKSGKKRRTENNSELTPFGKDVPKYVNYLSTCNKISCKFCKKDISKTMKVICAVCPDTVYCIDCLTLSRGIEEEDKDPQTHKHDYHILDKLDFNIFTEEWTAQEEVNLLSAIEKFGLDNWADISDHLTSKAKLQCEAHYYNFYYKSLNDDKPSEKDIAVNEEKELNKKRAENNSLRDEEKIKQLSVSIGKIPEFTTSKDNKNNRSRSLAKNRNRKDQTTITSASEVLGYWPKREEFDIEYLNDAELEIAELEFLDDDTADERNLKLNVLKVYNAQLEEREKRKKFVIERGLLDVKKQMNFEKKLSKDDREIYNCLKPFARFMDNSQFHELFEGIVLEKNLRQRLNQLKQYKKMGLKTYEEIEKYLEVDSRSKKEDKKSHQIYENCGLGGRLNRFLKFGMEENSELDSNEKEKDFIKNLDIPRSTYYDIKKRITKELLMRKDNKGK
jgi:transcriptional adapter 2-alpha